MKLRKVVFWLHLMTGLIVGSIVLIMSATGVLLAFERQLTEWADRDLRANPPATNASRLSIDSLIAAVRTAEPDAPISGLTLRSDLAAPAAFSLTRERTLFLNCYTGAVLGEGSQPARTFFRAVTNTHRWLAASDQNRELGRAITGACNVAFFFLVLSGFYLWWPRKWTRSAGRAIIWPRSKQSGRTSRFTWHNAVGFWCAPFLFFIVLSGILMSYPWATTLLYRLSNSEPPPARPALQRSNSPAEPTVVPPEIDRLWSIAAGKVPDWRSISVRFESSPATSVTFSIEQGVRGRPNLRSQLALDSASGEIVRWEPFSSFSLGRRLRTWARFVHTGEAFGPGGQTIAALASAGATVLVCTGFALAWQRFRGRKRRGQTMRGPDSIEALG